MVLIWNLWDLHWDVVRCLDHWSSSQRLTGYSFDPCFLLILWVSELRGYLRNWWQVLDIFRDYITIWAITKLAEAFRFFNWSAVGVIWSVELTAPSILSSSVLTVLTREFNLKICYRSNLRDFHVNTNYTEQGQRQSCLLNTDTCWSWSWHLTMIKIVQTENNNQSNLIATLNRQDWSQ